MLYKGYCCLPYNSLDYNTWLTSFLQKAIFFILTVQSVLGYFIQRHIVISAFYLDIRFYNLR